MKLLLIADGRSPITRRWIHMLQPLEYEIDLISTYPCPPVEGVQSVSVLPVAFARFSGSQAGRAGGLKKRNFGGVISQFRGLAAGLRHWIGPWTVSHYRNDYFSLLGRLNPDLVHALRLPFEGILASLTPPGIPVIVSTWGNDLTYHAQSTRKMGGVTRETLNRADGLLSDTLRDIRLAHDWGLDPSKPSLNVAGNGGIDMGEIRQVVQGISPVVPPQVINPRGFRSGSVRNDTFFKAIPVVLKSRPEVQFVCPWMAGQPQAIEWINKLHIENNVRLLPMLDQYELWREFARSSLTLSVSEHDGTPNSLLEAMTIGCLPVCGDIESIREWISPRENGLLIDPGDPVALAAAILKGVDDTLLRRSAAARNLEIIRDRAEVTTVRKKVAAFYQLVSSKK
jgi:glycosyltransferase involved in cell wall biosynthesis